MRSGKRKQWSIHSQVENGGRGGDDVYYTRKRWSQEVGGVSEVVKLKTDDLYTVVQNSHESGHK